MLVLFFLFCLFVYLIYKYVLIDSLTRRVIFIGFFIKLIYSVSFILIFTYYFGNGYLYGDSASFINDAKAISEIADNYPLEYIKLILGQKAESQELINPFIDKTNIWSYVGKNENLNDNRLIIRLNSIIHLFSNQFIYIHLLIHSFISFFGIVLIFRVFKKYVEHKKTFWFILLLFPSVAFFGGGISKESILIFSLGIYCFSLFNLSKKYYIKGLVYFIIGVLLLFYNKPYVGIFVVPISSILMIGYSLKWNLKYIKFILVTLISIFLLIVFIPNKIKLTERVSFRETEMINMAEGGVAFINDTAFCRFDYKYKSNFVKTNDTLIKVISNTIGQYKLFGTKEYFDFEIKVSDTEYSHYLTYAPSTSFFKTKSIDNSKLQLIKNIPNAIFNVIIRPFPWDNGDKFKIVVFIQNIGLIFFLIYSFRHRKVINDKEKWVLFVLGLSAFFITLLIGWTTPIFGAIVRYKVPVDLFIIIISFILLKSKQDEKK